MAFGSVLFFGLFGGGSLVLLTYLVRASVRARRVIPAGWLFIGFSSLFWLEAPFCHFVYASYSPDYPKFPHGLGPLDMVYGGLPIFTPLVYAVYFTFMPLICKTIAKWLYERNNWNHVRTLLASGFVFGFFIDFAVEQAFTSLNAFHYECATPWGATFPGKFSQFPVYISLGLATMHALTTYLLGRIDDQGDFLIERWARRVTSSTATRAALTIAASVLLLHVFYLAIIAPHVVVRSEKWATTSVQDRFYPSRANQTP